MNPTTNPFAPGAGTQPPELAGRSKIIADATVTLGRVKLGRPTKSQMLLGLRGVGKTVLLNRLAEVAEVEGYHPVMLEAPEDRRLAEMLVPPLRQLLFKLSRVDQAKDLAKRGLGVLRSFAKAFKVKVGDIEFTVEPELGTADSGSLESDLPEVLLAASTAAKQAGTAVALFIDEVQYLAETDLAALIISVHKMAQKGLPFVLFGAGLPQLAALAGEAKSYAERLFDYPEIGPLPDDAAREAIAAPIRREGAEITDDALTLIAQKTKGYPYFLQEWGSHTWNVAVGSAIAADDVHRATAEALLALDKGFFRVRLDRLTPREKEYMRAMAELGPGPHRSGEIAQKFGINVQTAGPLRNGLIKKGMIYSPQHGDTAFTVPMFDEFMCRSMPDWTPGAMPAAESRKKRKRQ
ncbi:MAG TPA: ATP-binding protein [Anaeromyxobacteraceae bacterium]|nr:ATP-binding protein [Anaeromyxobacteraceae bacterium]